MFCKICKMAQWLKKFNITKTGHSKKKTRGRENFSLSWHARPRISLSHWAMTYKSGALCFWNFWSSSMSMLWQVEARALQWQERVVPYTTLFFPPNLSLPKVWLQRVKWSKRTALMLFVRGGGGVSATQIYSKVSGMSVIIALAILAIRIFPRSFDQFKTYHTSKEVITILKCVIPQDLCYLDRVWASGMVWLVFQSFPISFVSNSDTLFRIQVLDMVR